MMNPSKQHSSIAEQLKEGRTVTYFTVGVSMRPLLKERKTHVVIVPAVEAEPGDIALYVRRNGAQVLHRCIRKGNDCLFMRGDNTYGLERIRNEQIIGVVTHVYRRGVVFDVRENRPYRAYMVFWNIIYPLRWLIWKMRTITGKIYRRIFR